MKTLLLLGLLLVLVNAAATSTATRTKGDNQQEVRRGFQPPLQSGGVQHRTWVQSAQGTHLRTARQATLQEHMLRPANHSADCCENGGTCILGSFCMCPANFSGRYCEQRAVTLPCGDVPHNDWMFQGCSLCRCGNGTFVCIEHMRPDCDSDPDPRMVRTEDSPNTLSIIDLFDQSRNSSSAVRGLNSEMDVTLLVSLLSTIATVIMFAQRW